MSISTMKVWIKCPSCGHTHETYDYYENTSSERCEYFVVLNNKKGIFACGECGEKNDLDVLCRTGFCSVENTNSYKKLFARALETLSNGEEVFFSDWDYDFRGVPSSTEQPALDRLCAMYPDDQDLARFGKLFRGVRAFGRDYINKLEVMTRSVGRTDVRWAPSLRKVYLHNTVETVESETFRDCSRLWDVFLPDSVKEIGDDAFLNSGIKTIHTSNHLVRIGKRAFKDCRSLSKIFLPEQLHEIGEGCFENCKSLSEVYLPDGILVGQGAFQGCVGLKRVDLPQSLKAYDASFFGLSNTVQIIWR